jgi:hypothetical protein
MVSKRNAYRRWLWILPVVAVAVLVLMSSQWLGTTTAQAPADKKNDIPAPKPAAAKEAAIFTAANGDISRTILITGELQAARSLEVQVPSLKLAATTRITFMAEEGVPIRKGEKLIEFDSAALGAQITDQKRVHDEATLNIEKKRKDLFDQVTLKLQEMPPQATLSRGSVVYVWNKRVKGAYPYQYRLPVRPALEKVWIQK